MIQLATVGVVAPETYALNCCVFVTE